MDEQVTPLTKSPLSQESRQIIARSTSVSAQTIQGSNLVSGVTPSETEIENLKTLQQNQASLVEVQSGILGIKQDINQLNSGLTTIATLLQQDAVNEENILRAQQESERRLAEEQIRIGKESEIEKKIQNAIVAPVNELAPKVQNLFGNVLESLGYLFGGWLTNQVIDYIEAEGEGDNERLTEIKNNILKNLAIAGGIILSVKFGIFALKRSLIGITAQIAKLIGKTVAAPFNGIKNILSGGRTSGGGKPPVGGGKPSGGGIFGTIGRGAKNLIGRMGFPLLTGSVMTGLDIASGEEPSRAVAGTTGGMIASGAAFALGSLIPIPGSGLVSSALAYGPGEFIGKGIFDTLYQNSQSSQTQNFDNSQSETEKTQSIKPQILQSETEKTQSIKSETPQKEVNPTQSLILPSSAESIATQKTDSLKFPQKEMIVEPNINFPDYSNIFNLSSNNVFDIETDDLSKSTKTDANLSKKIFSENDEMVFDVKPPIDLISPDNFLQNYEKMEKKENIFEKVQPIESNQIQTLPRSIPKVGELPEPKPNIIYASSSSSKKQGNQMNQTSTNGPLTDVPMIRSSNSDNFYTLYSYSCYNVVI
jgi:hypothetical protein